MKLFSAWWASGILGATVPGNRPGQSTLGASLDTESDGYLRSIQTRLKEAEVIPTVIDDFVPSLVLHVDWPDHQHASLGNILDPEKLQEQPDIRLYSTSHHAADADKTYVVTITDPDAPSRDDPKWSEFCHFIATGLPLPRLVIEKSLHKDQGHILSTGLTDVVSYKPPGPPPKTGKHRYVILVFAAANGTTDGLDLTKPSDRKHWGYKHSGHGVRDWAVENKLVPVAANFIFAQNDKQ